MWGPQSKSSTRIASSLGPYDPKQQLVPENLGFLITAKGARGSQTGPRPSEGPALAWLGFPGGAARSRQPSPPHTSGFHSPEAAGQAW